MLVNGHPEDEADPGPLELWRPSDEGWTQVEVTGERLSGRNFAAVASDEGDRHLVLHGGLTADGASGETWQWDGDSWPPGVHRSPRTGVVHSRGQAQA